MDLRPDVTQSRSTSDAEACSRKTCICLYAADRKHVTGSGSKKSAPPRATETSRIWVVTASDGVPCEREESLPPGLFLKTFVEPWEQGNRHWMNNCEH